MKRFIGFNYKYESSYHDRICLLESCGFDGVFIYSQYAPIEYIEILKKSSLEIEALHLPYKNIINGKCVDSRYVNVLWENNSSTEEYLDTLCKEIKFAHKWGVATVVMHITGGDSPPEINATALKNFSRVLEQCEKYKITLCLENLRRLDYLSYVFENIDSPYLKFCFDSGHANAMTKNLDSFPWSVFGEKLHCLHLNDNDGISDKHNIPFDGQINWNNLLPKLHSFNPNLNLTLEVRASRQERETCTEKEFLSRCMNSLDKVEYLIKE